MVDRLQLIFDDLMDQAAPAFEGQTKDWYLEKAAEKSIELTACELAIEKCLFTSHAEAYERESDRLMTWIEYFLDKAEGLDSRLPR